MIALTEKQRSELILFCSGELKVNNPLKRAQLIQWRDQIALASLTAETVNPADCFEPVYLSPPVPETKLPHELMDLVNAVEFYHEVKAENPPTETGMWKDAYDWIKKAAVEAAPVIKRLNGLGG